MLCLTHSGDESEEVRYFDEKRIYGSSADKSTTSCVYAQMKIIFLHEFNVSSFNKRVDERGKKITSLNKHLRMRGRKEDQRKEVSKHLDSCFPDPNV